MHSIVDFKLIEEGKKSLLTWQQVNFETKLLILQQIHKLLVSEKSNLYQILLSEGFPEKIAESYINCLIETTTSVLCQPINNFAKFVERNSATNLFLQKPDGLVLLCDQLNSPMLIAVAISLLLCGNGVVIISNFTTGSVITYIIEKILYPLLKDNTLPSGIILLIKNQTKEIVDQIFANAAIDSILFLNNENNNARSLQKKHSDKKIITYQSSQLCSIILRNTYIKQATESLQTNPFLSKQYVFIDDSIFDHFVNSLYENPQMISDNQQLEEVSQALEPHYRAIFSHVLQIGGKVYYDNNLEGVFINPPIIAVQEGHSLTRILDFVDEERSIVLFVVGRFAGQEIEVIQKMINFINNNIPMSLNIWTVPENISYFTQNINKAQLLCFNEQYLNICFLDFFNNISSQEIWKKNSNLQVIKYDKVNAEYIHNLLSNLGYSSLINKNSATPIRSILPSVSETQVNTDNNFHQDLGSLLYSFDNGIAKIELSRPKRHNSINIEMRDALYNVTDQLAKMASQLRVVVISGQGKSFCSGADLTDLTSFNPEQAKDYMLKVTWAFRRLEQLHVPVLAAVKGFCMGGGFEMVLHCDEIIASEDTIFCFPETGIGIVTTTGAVGRLLSAVGSMRAKPLLMGQRFGAKEALQIGLVSKVVSTEELESETENRCKEILKQPYEGIAAMKDLIRKCQADIGTLSWISEVEAFAKLAQGPWQQFVQQRMKKKD